jgi:hypothetical protein
MKYIMSKAELEKLTLIKGAMDGKYTVDYIAKRLGISTRQVKKLKKERARLFMGIPADIRPTIRARNYEGVSSG